MRVGVSAGSAASSPLKPCGNFVIVGADALPEVFGIR
jgi:hypothetical protein